MAPEILSAAPWYAALTLSERASLLRAGGQVESLSADTSQIADKRLATWRSQPPFDDASVFSRRCAMEGVSEEEFRYLLAGDPSRLARPSEPEPLAWVRELARVFSASSVAEPILPDPSIAQLPHAGFLRFLEPLIHATCTDLREDISKLVVSFDDQPFDTNAVVSSLATGLHVSLLQSLSPTLVLELNAARVLGELQGETSEERFQGFLDNICRPEERWRILQEYPVLARQLMLRARLWTESVVAFIQHFLEDWPDILETFQPAHPPGMLKSVRSGLGDSHQGGRSVVLLQFDSGFRVVYKPRPLHVDEHFGALLDWLNARSHLDLRAPKVLSRERHGWMEWIESSACREPSGVERFYRRQGGLIALFYVLDATDLHHENVIAAGEHPVMVDLESIFHQRRERKSEALLQEQASKNLQNSVLRSGLLPTKIWIRPEQARGVDVSGLGGESGQLVPGAFSWEGAGTDQMHLLRKSVPMPGAKNRPRLGDDAVDPAAYVEAIVEGFTIIYEILLRHQDELSSEDSILDIFASDENRFILRSTRSYAVLLQHGMHPDYQQDSLHRDRLFDHLWEGYDSQPQVADVIMAERRDLDRGDVPFFKTRPGSRDLWSSDGKRFPDFFKKSSLERVRSRIKELAGGDLERQKWIIRACLALVAQSPERGEVPAWPADGIEVIPSASRDFLKAATSIGEKLADTAFLGECDATWIGFVQRHDDYCNIEPLGSDFYSGQSGVAFFLAYLGTLTNDHRFSDLARRALVPVRRRLLEGEGGLDGIGAFAGLGGWIYTLTHLSALWSEDALLAEADAVLENLTRLIAAEDNPDVVGGLAGCLGALVARHKYRPDGAATAAALACGERLLAIARKPSDLEMAWNQPMAQTQQVEQALTGFSHGAAGIAWALAELYRWTNDRRFGTAAMQAIRHEKSRFSEKYGTWPNVLALKYLERQGEDLSLYEPRDSWCHGTAGIGLSRLRLLDILNEESIVEDIRRSIRFTLAKKPDSLHILCHGSLGNLDFLIEASRGFDISLRPKVERISTLVLQDIRKSGWRSAAAATIETPCLLTGLAGVGYGLLRCADADRVPSLLILDPPSETHSAPPAIRRRPADS